MSQPLTQPDATHTALRIMLSGRVQGVGMRPAVARLAASLELAGTVSNETAGVKIVVEGLPENVEQFRKRLREALPEAALLERVTVDEAAPIGADGFKIEQCESAGPLRTRVPADLATCDACLNEVASPKDRRHGYPLTSCTNCGPRYSIIAEMPYERARTTMAAFELCPRCRREYADPVDRRFHAQTNACPECGPRVWLADGSGQRIAASVSAVETAARAVRDGRILALRGLGGYQLIVDATDPAAVDRLRQRKRRPAKPLAVLVASMAQARELAVADALEERTLASPQNPIVLLRARESAHLAPGVHPGMDRIGLMLPTTPLHRELLRLVRRPLVCTSGNVEGEPLAADVTESEDRLAGVADVWLHHDRPVHRPVDDSVVRVIAGRAVTIRAARGYAPLPLDIPAPTPVLAVGGHQTGAVALANGAQAVLGPHLGDMDGLATRERFQAHVAKMIGLYGVEPGFLVHDLHPDYFTTRWAQQQPQSAVGVQHHHAHVAAGMLEHGWLDRTVLGAAFDGTGYGPDGTIWGGEFLLATATGYRRVAHLHPFALPGGEQAVRQPWRVAVELARQAAGAQDAFATLWPNVNHRDVHQLLRIAGNRRFSPRTTSAGRLFDAVASLVLSMESAQFEGQPAMLLEAACDPADDGAYELPVRGTEVAETPMQVDWRPMVRALLADRAAGTPPAAMAIRFHRGLADAVTAVCRRYAAYPVVCSGGVFQNRILTELVAERLDQTGQPAGLPGKIPPGDGGLAAGQLAVARARLSAD